MTSNLATQSNGSHPPVVSIIVPAYNAQAQLDRCIQSVTSQTYPTLELIIVDDGSIDSTNDIAQSHAQNDSRIKVVTQENQGVSAARNAGIAHAGGDWLLFVDSDDWIGPTLVEESLRLAAEHECSVVKWGITLHSTERVVQRQATYELALVDGSVLYRDMLGVPEVALLSSCGVLFSAALIREHHIQYPVGMTNLEDVAFMAQVYATDVPVHLPNAFPYHYELNEVSASQSYSPGYFASIHTLYDLLKHLEASCPSVSDHSRERLLYCSLSYALALAQEVQPGAEPFQRERATNPTAELRRLCQHPALRECFAQARAHNALSPLAKPIDALMRTQQFGLLSMQLKTLNIARNVRRQFL